MVAPAWFTAMALMPAAAVASALIVGSPRWLVAATTTMVVWATILGVLGLASFGLPLILVAFLAYRILPACADGQLGRPDQTWVRRMTVVSGLVGLAFAFAALLTTGVLEV